MEFGGMVISVENKVTNVKCFRNNELLNMSMPT